MTRAPVAEGTRLRPCAGRVACRAALAAPWRGVAALTFSLLLAVPAMAQEPGPREPTPQERFEALIDRLLGRLQPEFEALGEMLGDLSGWHAPEILPNGDILIRRRAQPPAPDPSPDPSEEEPPVIDPLEL